MLIFTEQFCDSVSAGNTVFKFQAKMQNFPGVAHPISSHYFLNKVHLLAIPFMFFLDSSQDSKIFPQSLIKADFFNFWDYVEPASYQFVSPTLPKFRLTLKSNTQIFYLIVILQPIRGIYYNNKTYLLMFSSFFAVNKIKYHSLILEVYKDYYVVVGNMGVAIFCYQVFISILRHAMPDQRIFSLQIKIEF